MPIRRTNINMDEDLHALATEHAKERGLSLSALIDEALRDKILWQIASWWKSEGESWPSCLIERQNLTPCEYGPAFLEAFQRHTGKLGFVSVAACPQGQTPRWTPPISTDEDIQP